MLKKIFFILIPLTSLFFACKDKKETADQPGDLLSQRAAFEIQALPGNLQPKDTLNFSAIQSDTSLKFDSLILFLDGKKRTALSPENIRFSTGAGDLGMGLHQFRLAGFLAGKENGSGSVDFIIHADAEPESWTYEIVKTLPHNQASFTQGLEWNDGRLYEGTGLNGKSHVMEISPASGESILKTSLSEEHFGEGITILNRKLYQLTWQSHRAFVYSLPDLKQVNTLGYPTEGWGLSHLGNELLLSDGSEKIYFLRPEDFSLIRSIQVWDTKNAVKELNELEVADGILYANKYQTDTIVKIDPANGKVLGYINMEGLLKKEDRTGGEDVLNGIAWNSSEKLWYLTGKNWPKMFAVKWIKKKSV
jgi:glutamine cyclotransferase